MGRRAIVTLITGLTLAGCADDPPGTPPDAGVPLDVARDRARDVTELSYQIRFAVPESRDEPVLGEVQLMFEWDGRAALPLDFAATPDQIHDVDVNGSPLDLEMVNEHLIIPRTALRRGSNIVRISFVAGDGSLNRTDQFLYTLFVPDRARWAFPVFDQPDLKARFSLTLDLPGDWVGVGNGEELEVAGAMRPGEGDRIVYRLAETEPIPTYLFAFAAGRFRIEEAERGGRTMRLFHRETDRAKVERNLDAIFDLHASAIDWLEDYTQIDYPFGKFDFVAVPSFQYGGMEHPGSIFYRASSMFLEESATQGQVLGRAGLIAHETAHMWFGDLVTMEWFNDVWMKEVFANFMAAKIVNPSFPEIDHDLRFLLSHYPSAYAVDRTAGANPIRQPLENLNEAGTLYGAIIYQKAPIVMKHLELLIGEEAFRDGLREYLAAHAFGNATWSDLIAILDLATELDLREWSRSWVEEPGRPTVETVVSEVAPDNEPTGRGGHETEFRQRDPRGRELLWAQPLQPWYGRAGGGSHQTPVLRIEGESVSTFAAGPRLDVAILPNGSGIGYGLFPQTDESREWLLANLPLIEAAQPRAVAWLTLWDELLEGALTPDAWMSTALAAVEAESEELLVSRMTGDLRTAFWRFLDEDVRTELLPQLEGLFWSRLESAESTSMKASFFNAYLSIAGTTDAVRRLESIWRAGGGVPGLPLAERDLIRLARELAVREVDGWERIMDRQAERIENADRQAEFEFVRPALSADRAVRDAFFASLADPTNREREPWVLSAVGWLHHPLRAEASRDYLLPSLELLEEIQRTGDIFFPKRWLDASLGGHASPEAAETVRGFLSTATLPPRLEAKLLQSADLLFRAAALRN
jgi:aminopeptidase N